MPFIGNAGQFSNIHEKNYASSTLRVVEGDALYQAYNPADSHYKLITTLQEVTTIGSVTANTIQFTNPITSLVTSSNIGVANTQPMHTLDVGANVYIDDIGSNTFHTSGTTYASEVTGETAKITSTVTVRDTIVDKIYPKTYDFVQFMSNVGVLNTAPIHTLDIGANVQIDELGSNTFYTSGNVHAYKFSGEEITLTGTIVASDFVLSGGSQATPTPQIQTISEVLPQTGQIAFSSDRTLTLSNVTAGMNVTVINAITTNSNLVGDNITAVTTRSNLIASNVTVDNDLIVNTDDFVVDTVNSRVGINKASPTKDLDVTGEIECSSHLTVGGNISGNGDAVFRKYTFASPGSGQYSVIGPGFDTATVNPTLTLMRGQKYVFDNTVHGSHPLQIRDGYEGSAYTDGVSGTSTITFEVPMDAPIKLYYQCTQHPAMGNIIYIPESTLDTTMALSLSNNLVVTGTSNVGIGIASPGATLDIRGATDDPSTPTVHIGDNNADTGDYGMVNLVRDATNGGSKSHLAFIRNGHTVVGMGFHNNTNTWGIFPSFNGVTNTPALAIDYSGNVGIGSAIPDDKLEIYKSGGSDNVGMVIKNGTRKWRVGVRGAESE